MSNHPYPGLRPFRPDEADIFFGREEQIDQLVDKLGKSHFLAVLGTSGAGKSSLVKAGLIPALDTGLMATAGPRWTLAKLQPGSRPIVHLAESLIRGTSWGCAYAANHGDVQKASASMEQALRQGPLALSWILGKYPLPRDNRLLILVDQFEELFRYRRDINEAEAAAFVDLLLAASEHPDVYVVITMRSDFVNDCVSYIGLPETVNSGLFLTPRLTPEQMADAIQMPARVFGGDVEPDLVKQLLQDAKSNLDQLPLLQHAIMRLWDQNAGKVLTLSEYGVLGGLQGALDDHAEEVFRELNADEQLIAEILFRSLTERGPHEQDMRRPVPLTEVASIASVTPNRIREIINVFAKSPHNFLVLSQGQGGDSGGADVVDISHESLIRQWKRLNQWSESESEYAKQYRRLEDSARRWKNHQAALLTTPELEVNLEWRRKAQPIPEWADRYGEHFDLSMQFLRESETERQKKQRQIEDAHQHELQRKRKQVTVTLIAFVIATVLALWGFTASFIANVEKQKAEEASLHLFNSQLSLATQLAHSEDYANAKNILEETHKLDSGTFIPAPRLGVRNWLSWFVALMGGDAETDYKGAGGKLFAVDTDGHLVAAAGENGTLVLFDAHSGQLLQRLTGHSYPIKDVSFHPKSQWLASAGEDQRIILWSLQPGKKPAKRATILETDNAVSALAVSPDGIYLASGGYDGDITLWNVEKEQVKQTFKGHKELINELAFSPSGKFLASASNDNSARLWRTETGQVLHELTEHTGNVNNVIFSSDGGHFATGSDDNVVRLWAVASGRKIRDFYGHRNRISGLRFLAHGQHLVSSSQDSTIRIWDIERGVVLRVLQAHTAQVNDLAHQAGKLFTASNDGTVMRWETALPYQQIIASPGRPLSTAIANDGGSLAVGHEDGTLRLYSLPDVRLLWERKQAHKDRISRLSFSSDGHLLASASIDTAKIWKISNGKLTNIPHFHGEDDIHDVAFAPDARTLAAASYNGQIRLFRVDTEETITFSAATDIVTSMDFDSTGTRLLSTGGGEMKLWNIRTDRPSLSQAFPHAKDVIWASLSPNDNHAASVDRHGYVRIYSTSDGRFEKQLARASGRIFRVTFSPTGQGLLTISTDGVLRLWDLNTGIELYTLKLSMKRIFPSSEMDWQFDIRCTPKGCWIALPLLRNQLLLYEVGKAED